jgi:hypothetical protein
MISKSKHKTRKLFDERQHVFVDTTFDLYNAQIIGRYNLVMVVGVVTVFDSSGGMCCFGSIIAYCYGCYIYMRRVFLIRSL